MTGWLFEPLCCLADFPCESKLSQTKGAVLSSFQDKHLYSYKQKKENDLSS